MSRWSIAGGQAQEWLVDCQRCMSDSAAPRGAAAARLLLDLGSA